MAGIFILETKGPEFRPAYADSIDAVCDELNDVTHEWNFNRNELLKIFENSKVYNNYKDALEASHRMAQNFAFLDDGIMVLDDWFLYTFEDILYDGIIVLDDWSLYTFEDIKAVQVVEN